ncbi:MAG: TioA protein [Citrobacter sp.]|uniref:TioA protein n=1 Tax=Citrobacter sp. TaxID=1896336 RepID=UPI002FC5FFF3
MIKYHPVHIYKNSIKKHEVTDFYFVELPCNEDIYTIDSFIFFKEIYKSFDFFNKKNGISKYILRVPYGFALLNMENINKLNGIGLFAVAVDFNNNYIFLNEYIRGSKDYGVEVWFDFCGKYSHIREITNFGFFFQAGVVPNDSNLIDSIYDYHLFPKILVEDVNHVDQRTMYQNKVDYMYGMQWPPSYDGDSFRTIKTLKKK